MEEIEYRARFKDPDFGASMAAKVAQKLGFAEAPRRLIEGSNLVFAVGPERFLKLSPSFFESSTRAEIAALRAVGAQLTIAVPQLLAEGVTDGWNYIVTRTVEGQQAKTLVKNFDTDNVRLFVAEIGKFIGALHRADTHSFEVGRETWGGFLGERLRNQHALHLKKGNDAEWSKKLCDFVEGSIEDLRSLGPAKLVHADLNHEHLLLRKEHKQWRLCGVLDWADAMMAPVEMDFVLPILCFCRGRSDLQELIFEEAGIKMKFRGGSYSRLMMALTLQDRFMAFHDWFRAEIRAGATSVEEVAEKVFPAT